MIRDRFDAYKGFARSGVSKEITSSIASPGNGPRSEWLGPVEKAVIDYCVFMKVRRFKPSFIAEYLTSRGLASKEKKLSLQKRIHDALQRLVARGIVRKLAHGLYELAQDPVILSKMKPVKRESHVKPREKVSKERSWVLGVPFGGFDGFGSSFGSSGLGVVGPVFDNVRFGGFGGVVGSLSLVSVFDNVRFGEFGFRVGPFSSDLVCGGLGGVFVVYGSRFKDPGGWLRFELRPRRKLVRLLRSSGFGVWRRVYVLWLAMVLVGGLKIFDFVASYDEKLWLAGLLGGLGLGWLRFALV